MPAPGLQEGRLLPCPSSPNCVCSQDPDPRHRVEPIPFQGSVAEARSRLLSLVAALDRVQLVEVGERYLRAEVRSPVLRFVDDLEILIDPTAGLIHLRSAARTGYWDLGVNRRRAEELRRRFLAAAAAGG